MAGLFEKLFNGEKKRLKELEEIANNVELLREETAALSDDDLKAKTAEFKQRINEGATTDDLMVEAFAVAREASKRVIGEFPYLVQIMGAAAMHKGDIAEMKTGEGKTLTSVLCVYLNALAQEGVHVVTVNEYLAERDANWMGKIHEFLGLSVSVNKRDLTTFYKRKAYACDITYTTNSELGFDYLRDNMVTKKEERVMRGLNVAIVDEVDSILIDESRTPLIISGGARQTANLYKQADTFAKRLSEEDYEIDEKTKAIQLSEQGVTTAEKAFKITNLYDLEHTQLVHHIQQALKANFIMKNEVEYVVQDGEIVLVDQFTGRLMKGRAYSDGLHQAIEAKEGVNVKQETSTLATITYQNFFRLYAKLAGMTGTAKTEEEEFLSIYNMRVVEIPTNSPVIRQDLRDAVFAKESAKFNALVDQIVELYATGEPVLVGTISVETSELVSKLLKAKKIPHEVLNAKNNAREAEIIAKAGQVKSVTIATNMAGRGTDIKLSDEARALGGLVVLGSERHDSRRIDNQLRGRSGRQGDPGFSRFYVSFEDEIMVRFGGEKAKKVLSGAMGEQQLESSIVSKLIETAQKRVEGYNFDIRKSLLEYDDVLRQQREIMYDQRNYVLENEDVHGVVNDMFSRVISSVVDANVEETHHNLNVNAETLIQGLEVLGIDNVTLVAADFDNKTMDEIKEVCINYVWNVYDSKIADIRESFAPYERDIVLKIMDRNWIDHIDMMAKLRDGIHLRSYAQDNPLQAYIKEGYDMFEDMMQKAAREILFLCLKIKVERQPVKPTNKPLEKPTTKAATKAHAKAAAKAEAKAKGKTTKNESKTKK
ncbi:MAG: preprotein translocase subunit SecA [Erysipelotrichaceae bacterium]